MEKSSEKPTLLITGINGYLGSWTTLKALESGEYKVRGTVRDITNETKVNALKEAFGDHFNDIELVNADLLDKESLAKAAEGVDYILHMASPYPFNTPKNEDDVVKPAVEGTTGILEAIRGSSVKRVVVTSSCVAIMDHTKGDIDVDDDNWPSNQDDLPPYYKSKVLAEKAAWDFIDSLGDDEKIELCTVNPGVVSGPLLVKGEGASQKIFTDLLTGGFPSCPQMHLPVVDVHDVAEAHLKALKSKPGMRFAMNENTYSFSEMGEIVRDEFAQYGYSVSYKTMWKSTAWMASFFLRDAANFLRCWNVRCHVKNDRAKNELGIEFKPAKESIVEMCYSLIKHGYAPDRVKKD